jgi:hypothetical protein
MSVLKRAKEILIERGMASGDIVDAITGECCIVGAIALAEGWEPEFEEIEDHFGKRIRLTNDEDAYEWVNENTPIDETEAILECAGERFDDPLYGEKIESVKELYKLNDGFDRVTDPLERKERVFETLDCAIAKVEA